jgi:hypothetical protein
MIDVDLQWVGLEEAVTNTPVQSLRHVVTPFLRKRGEGQIGEISVIPGRKIVTFGVERVAIGMRL